MSWVCAEPDCMKCSGAACTACLTDNPALPIGANCTHDDVERHYGMQPLEPSRVPTKPMPPIELDEVHVMVDDPESFASALEEIAKRVRLRGKFTIK